LASRSGKLVELKKTLRVLVCTDGLNRLRFLESCSDLLVAVARQKHNRIVVSTPYCDHYNPQRHNSQDTQARPHCLRASAEIFPVTARSPGHIEGATSLDHPPLSDLPLPLPLMTLLSI
jgi:hypothetical protein